MAMGKPRGCGTQFLSAALIILLFLTSAVTISEGRYLEQEKARSGMNQVHTVNRRHLIGSSPPTCRGRCGRCNPCRPVHVAIHPGMLVPLEYYPEVWRCQCGNKLFMP